MGTPARAPRGITSLLTKAAPKRPKKHGKLLASVPDVPAAPVDKLSAIEAIPDQYVDCRDVGHNWRRFSASWNEQDHQFEQTFRCRGCATLKHRFLDRFGNIVGHDYSYPDGYVMPKGMGFLSSDERSIIRLRAVTTMGDAGA